MVKAYIRTFDGDFDVNYSLLNPTGRYRETTNSYGNVSMLIEHKGWFFKKWIDERDIEFLPEIKDVIFNCNAGS